MLLAITQVDDLDGAAHYRTLGLEAKASSAEVKKVSGGAAAVACPPPTCPRPPPRQAFMAAQPPPPALAAMQAYRLLAKRLHPDKGGDPAAFARLQGAFDVLGDARKRAVYDTWAKQLQFRSEGPWRDAFVHLEVS